MEDLMHWDGEAVRVLADFLPHRIFDAHAHLLHTDFTPAYRKRVGREVNFDLKAYEEEMIPALCFPRELRLNIIGYPDPMGKPDYHENIARSDAFLTRQLDRDGGHVGEILITPSDTAESLEKRIALHSRIRGLKCYHLYAARQDTFRCDAEEYLPECAWETAHRHKLAITLHLVKDRALADEKNQKYITDHAKKYPDARLILAHGGRAFAARTAVETAEAFARLENVFFDFSGLCESPAMIRLLQKVGSSRCMWGSDYPICRGRGKAVSIGDSFFWIREKELALLSPASIPELRPILAENLLATRQACLLADLPPSRVEDLFYRTADLLFDA